MVSLVRIALNSTLHVRGSGAAAGHHRTACRASHADRYFPEHPHPRHRRGLAIHRLAAGRHGGAHHHAISAGADDDRQRHRAYRGEFVQRRRHHQDFLPAQRQHRDRQRAGHGDLADDDQADAGGRHAAADPQLQRLDGADPPARAVRRGPDRAEPRRSRPQLSPHAARHGAGRGDSVSLRRQDAPGPDRPRSVRIAGARPVRRRTSPMRSPRRT